MTALLLALASLLPAQEGRLDLKLGEKLAADTDVPVAFSRDGKALLFLTEENDDTYTYWLADADGKKAKQVYRSPVDWNDVLTGFISPCCLSRDGKRVAVASTKGGMILRKAKDTLHGGYCTADGEYKPAPIDDGFTGSAFAGDRFLYLDSAVLDRGNARAGYRLQAWDGKDAKTLHMDKELGGAILRASPDGKRVAFLVMGLMGKRTDRTMRLRVVDLETKKAVDTDPFKTDDVTYDGPPLFYWDAEGKGLFYHSCPDDGASRPFSLLWFDPAKGKSETLFKDENIGVLAVLDNNHVAVMLDKRKCAVLRLKDRKQFPLADEWLILGGHGRRLVVTNRQRPDVRCAEFELPKAK